MTAFWLLLAASVTVCYVAGHVIAARDNTTRITDRTPDCTGGHQWRAHPSTRRFCAVCGHREPPSEDVYDQDLDGTDLQLWEREMTQ